MKSKIIIEADVPNGYELTGEYRFPLPQEPFLTSTGIACVCHDNDQCGRRMNRIILRKVQPWIAVDAAPDLLAACEQFAAAMRKDGGGIALDLIKALQAADAAIAKATKE